ncbi:hypothetical protein PBRA_005458 [Plasmodiophora brassicae]|uniref:Uncharacterized protein n=1 Tax=Plasmodiophora brassicae TaxID=37360 RepID=A0A0G4INT3_PLABS|nr:hypothetical protein PBRA_005458 [Plasmodiophora brassicae]
MEQFATALVATLVSILIVSCAMPTEQSRDLLSNNNLPSLRESRYDAMTDNPCASLTCPGCGGNLPCSQCCIVCHSFPCKCPLCDTCGFALCQCCTECGGLCILH